jgi:hypothetical protein
MAQKINLSDNFDRIAASDAALTRLSATALSDREELHGLDNVGHDGMPRPVTRSRSSSWGWPVKDPG